MASTWREPSAHFTAVAESVRMDLDLDLVDRSARFPERLRRERAALRLLDPMLTPGSRQRLVELHERWLAESRAISTLLLELEAELDLLVRDLSFHLTVGEARPDLEARVAELAVECEDLATESAHVQLALAGIRGELERIPDEGRRTPA